MNAAAFQSILKLIALVAGVGPAVEAVGEMIAALRQDRAFTPEQDAALDAEMERAFAGPAWQPEKPAS